MPLCRIISCLGLVPYADALAEQRTLALLRQTGAIPDTLLLLEHPPTITLGRGSEETDLLSDTLSLCGRGIAVERVDRGGEITYHGPGQLVGYPILDLREHGQDLHRYLRDLEQVVIQTLGAFGISGCRIPSQTGVWVGGSKIAAIGIKVSRWVSQHGFALNITTDLAPFRRDFIPCGIRDKDVTSLRDILGDACPTRPAVEEILVAAFAEVFTMTPTFQTRMGILEP